MNSKATANPILTQTAVKFMHNASEFAGRALFPTFSTNEQASQYYVFDRENALNIPTDIQRAPGSSYKRSVMTLSDDSYACKDYGHEEPVDDVEKAKYASALDADRAAVTRSTNIVMVNHELRAKALATGAGVATSSPSTKWDAASADPIGDVDAVREVIHDNCGLDANTMVISRDVFNVLKELDVILQKIKYVQKGIVTADLLAPIFSVERIVVAGIVRNSAAEGQTVSPSKIWGDSVILAHVNSAQDLKAPNFGRTFNWSKMSGRAGMMVKSYRQEEVNSDVHRVAQYTDEKLVGAECGYHLSSVLTA
ncbi:MAG: hypothetical protein ACQKBY_06060 [Verrucomicrobiales bacterium]